MLYTSIWYVDLTSSQYRQTNLVSTSNANIESTCDRVYEIDIESRSFRCHFYKVDSTLNSTSTIESRSYRPWNDIESMLLVTRVCPIFLWIWIRVSTHTWFLTAHGYRLNDIRKYAHICANMRAYYPFEHADTHIIRKYAHICATMRAYLVCVETLLHID